MPCDNSFGRRITVYQSTKNPLENAVQKGIRIVSAGGEPSLGREHLCAFDRSTTAADAGPSRTHCLRGGVVAFVARTNCRMIQVNSLREQCCVSLQRRVLPLCLSVTCLVGPPLPQPSAMTIVLGFPRAIIRISKDNTAGGRRNRGKIGFCYRANSPLFYRGFAYASPCEGARDAVCRLCGRAQGFAARTDVDRSGSIVADPC